MDSLSDIESWLVPIGLVILFLFGLYIIKKKSSGWRFYRRALLFLIGCLGLYLSYVEPDYKVPLDTVQAHILSAHADVSLENANVYRSVNDFLNSEEAARTDKVTIYGFGLSAVELDQLDDYKINFSPSPLVTGITSMEIPPITEGSSWFLRGKVASSDSDMPRSVKMSINSKNYKVDILDGVFSIESVAPPAGRYIVDLDILTSAGDTISEITSVNVLHEPTWNMLVLSSYPTFELNYLKNYWTSLGNGFAMKSKVSKEKYQTSYVNAPVIAIEELTYQKVKQFDFIITDVSSWNDLSDIERRNVLGVVSKEGSSLILRPQRAGEKAVLITHPQWSEAEEEIVSRGQEEIELINYPIASAWRSMRYGKTSLAKYASRGLGHIGVLSIGDTYRLILADQNVLYQNIWSEIFSNLFVDFNAQTQILGDQWIWADEQRMLQLYHPEKIESAPILNDSTTLSLLEVPFLENVVEVDVWSEQGYNQLSFGDNESGFVFYAHNKDSWAAMRQDELYTINGLASVSSKGIERGTQFQQKTISYFWWYALVLFGFCGLWIDERLYD